MKNNLEHYWACSACDSGGHPLTLSQAMNGAWDHIENAGHFAVYGRIKEARI